MSDSRVRLRPLTPSFSQTLHTGVLPGTFSCPISSPLLLKASPTVFRVFPNILGGINCVLSACHLACGNGHSCPPWGWGQVGFKGALCECPRGCWRVWGDCGVILGTNGALGGGGGVRDAVAVKDFGGSGRSWVFCGLRKMLRVHVGAVQDVLNCWWGPGVFLGGSVSDGGSGRCWGVVSRCFWAQAGTGEVSVCNDGVRQLLGVVSSHLWARWVLGSVLGYLRSSDDPGPVWAEDNHGDNHGLRPVLEKGFSIFWAETCAGSLSGTLGVPVGRNVCVGGCWGC